MAHGNPPPGEFGPAEPESGTEHVFELGTDGPKIILAGIDESVTAARAGAYAAGLARRQHAAMIAIYVAAAPFAVAPSAATASMVSAEIKAHDAIAAELRARYEAVARELGISITFIAATGDPYNEIKRVANEVRADAIIVGASAKAGHRLIGSLAVRLVRAGAWPVTVVP